MGYEGVGSEEAVVMGDDTGVCQWCNEGGRKGAKGEEERTRRMVEGLWVGEET